MSCLVLNLLLFLILHPTVGSSLPSHSQSQQRSSYHLHDCNALIQFLASVKFFSDEIGSSMKDSWKNGTNCCLSWDNGITCNNVTGRVISLRLHILGIEGPLASNSTLFSLRDLQELDLSGNMFMGPIPASLGNLTALTHLDLSGNNFIGPIPASLGNLTSLSHLDLSSNNNFSGSLDFEIFSSTRNLQYLYLPENIKPLVRDHGNCSFPEMRDFRLNGQNFTKFPYFLSSMEKLENLDLTDNMIDGGIPSWLEKLHRLDFLSLSGNHITGVIPSSICQLSSLGVLDLSSNGLNGTIPACLGNFTDLYHLDLSSNHLHGSLPRSLANCTHLERFSISHNRINDTFPQWLLTTGLYFLDWKSNEFHGHIPFSTQFLSLEAYLYISDNQFTGQWPPKLLLNSSINQIDISNNKFEGPFPSSKLGTIFYSISNNKFTGEIPSSICSVHSLQVLDASNNNFTGYIPQCFIKLQRLRVLNLRENGFHGAIPEIFAPGSKLRTIQLSRNQLGGTLPQSLVHCKHLEVLDISYNRIEDVFPGWLRNLPNLKVLVLKSNKFYGNISNSSITVTHPFYQLHIFDISYNYFCGSLPLEYITNFKAMASTKNNSGSIWFHSDLDPFADYSYQDSIATVLKGLGTDLVKILNAFMSIDLSRNCFQGEIPRAIGNLKALKGLNFSHNNLTGVIPSSIGNLTNLEWLDLSSNDLNGEIPVELVDITSLEVLNLSKNQLTGQIPQGKQFNTFKSDSFDGNPGLCGVPLPKSCVDHVTRSSSLPCKEDTDDDDSWIEWRAVLMGYGWGIVFGISVSYIILETARPIWVVKIVEGEQMRIMNWFKSRKTSLARRRQGQS